MTRKRLLVLMGIGNMVVGPVVVFSLLFINPTIFECTGYLATGYRVAFGIACLVFLTGIVILVSATKMRVE